MNLKKITVTILTYNSSEYLEEILYSLASFGEVLILDSGSSDDTLPIAKRFPNVSIEKTLFDGFGSVHNKAVSIAKNFWILSIDSDEIITKELVKEIESLEENQKTVYAIPRKNFYNNKWIQRSGWYPDYVFRLFHKESTRFTLDKVHESVITKGLKTARLKAPLLHYSYKNTAAFLAKMQSYSTLWAEQNKGKKSSLYKALTHAFWAFFRCYFLQRGFLDGKEGFIISFYNANTTFYKYLKLAKY